MRLGIDLTASGARRDTQDVLIAQRDEAAGPRQRPGRAERAAHEFPGLEHGVLERCLAAGASAPDEDDLARKPLRQRDARRAGQVGQTKNLVAIPREQRDVRVSAPSKRPSGSLGTSANIGVLTHAACDPKRPRSVTGKADAQVGDDNRSLA